MLNLNKLGMHRNGDTITNAADKLVVGYIRHGWDCHISARSSHLQFQLPRAEAGFKCMLICFNITNEQTQCRGMDTNTLAISSHDPFYDPIICFYSFL